MLSDQCGIDRGWDYRRLVVKHEQVPHLVVPRGNILERVGALVRSCVGPESVGIAGWLGAETGFAR